MGRIGATLSGFERTLLNSLADSEAAIAVNNLRLATGKKINTASDDPFAFIQLNDFRAQLQVVESTSNNIAAASSTVSKVQLTLGLIRTQLDTIRTNAVADEDGALTGSQRTANQAAIDAAITEINRLTRADIDGKRLLDGSADFGSGSINSTQVSELIVHSLGGPTIQSRSTEAELIHTGSAGLITGAATITLTGNSGSFQTSVATTDSLAQVAQNINEQSDSTGVKAVATGDQLKILSTDVGSRAKVSVVVDSGSFTVNGGNGSGSDSGTDAVLATGPTINGNVQQAATQAQLLFTGGSGQINSGDATFTLAGERGTASISVTNLESLSTVATRINAEAHKTGVTASASGDLLTFASIEFGRDIKIQVTTTTGTFAVTGGNGDTTANGTDAIVVINGQTLTGDQDATAAQLVHDESTGLITAATQFTLTGPTGTASITLSLSDTLAAAAIKINNENGTTGVTATVSADNKQLIFTSDTTGSANSIKIDVFSGTIALDGGNGDGTADGTDAISGAVNGNQVTFVDNQLHFSLELAPTFTGTLDTISLDAGGSLSFALSTDLTFLSTLGIFSTHATNLGGLSGSLDQLFSGGSASGLNTNAPLAIRIVDEALGDLDLLEGKVDGFFKAAITSSKSLTDSFETNIQDSIDLIDKVDNNEETLLLAKNSILLTNAINALAILDQNRASVLNLVKRAAGFI